MQLKKALLNRVVTKRRFDAKYKKFLSFEKGECKAGEGFVLDDELIFLDRELCEFIRIKIKNKKLLKSFRKNKLIDDLNSSKKSRLDFMAV